MIRSFHPDTYLVLAIPNDPKQYEGESKDLMLFLPMQTAD